MSRLAGGRPRRPQRGAVCSLHKNLNWRIAGEIALKSPEPDTATAQSYFERAVAVARQQQAKSWELRASMSLARLWRDQGKVQQARELLAPVYGWFTEGFDTRDLKEAKALLEELQA
jgi:predicted ATPase